MSQILTNNKHYSDIADTIRQMKNVNTTYKPREMASALKDIYSNEVEGVPPLSFESNGMPLIDYRIDGANGGVGDRTSNLFDYSTVTTGYRITWSTGINIADDSAIMSDFIAVSNGIYRASVSVNLIGYDINKNYIGTYDPINKIFRKDYSSKTTYYDIADNNVKFVKLLSYSATDTISQDTMFCNSTTILEYEPYGYKVPVVCGGITTNIYLDKPIYIKANIPNEYTEVEYLESTGTQYIDTNIIPTDTTGVEAKITICNDNNRDNVFMGCRETSGGESRYWIDVDWTGNDTLIFGFNGNTILGDRYSLKPSDVGKSFVISMNYMNDRVGKINGITYDTSISSKTLVSISKPMYIFAGNRSGNAAYQYSGKLYNLKITDGTNVIKNFVPCYRNSDNVAGLYDLVNSTFYTNQGTGNFKVGPIKENESISLSDTNVDIPTIEGTNVLTIDTTVQPSNVYIQARKNPDFIALDMSNIKFATSTFTTLPSVIANADWSNVTDAAGMFNLCSSLTTVPELDLSSATNLTQMFNYCIDLTTLGGFKNLGQAYLTSKSSNYSEYKLNLSSCTQLTHDSLMNVINNLYDIATKGCNTQELILGSTNLSKLTAEEIAIATNKGWSVS